MFKRMIDIWNQEGVASSNFDNWVSHKEKVVPILREWNVSGSIIDVGCGPGVLYHLMPEIREDYIGTDISRGMLSHFKKIYPQAITCCNDVRYMHFNKIFDFVVCLSTVIYFEEDKDLETALSNLFSQGNFVIINAVIGDKTEHRRDHMVFERNYFEEKLKRRGKILDQRNIGFNEIMYLVESNEVTG
jgi:SAM-dependent methyltransferase